VVLLHGFITTAEQWLQHGPAAALAEQGYRVILPDLRGHGDSARPHDTAAYPSDVLADDGLALIDQLGLDDYDLGGYSLGGRIVLRMLVRGARPAHAVVAGQGLAAVSSAVGSGTNRRVLTALASGDAAEPGSPDAEAAYWITQLGGDRGARRGLAPCAIRPSARRPLDRADRTGVRDSDHRVPGRRFPPARNAMNELVVKAIRMSGVRR
jgi:pimeloyl-ACP methyl ester carboxylesterase